MNVLKLQHAFANDLLTDLTLVLYDSTEKLTMNVHKIVLFTSCEYFEHMLTNYKEKNASTITMKVANVFVMQDIIMSFYGKTKHVDDCRYQLDKIKCLDYLGLEIDLSYFEKNVVRKEDFELLLDVVDIIGYNTKTIEILADNIPEDYDLKLLPRNLLQEMHDHQTRLKIVTNCFKCHGIEFKNYDPRKNGLGKVEIDKKIPYDPVLKYHIDFSLNGEKLFAIFSNGIVHIHDIYTNDVIEKKLINVDDSRILKRIYFDSCEITVSPDENIVVFNQAVGDYFSGVFHLELWNLDSGKLIKIVPMNKYTVGLHFTADSKWLILYYDNGEKITLNVENGNCEKKDFLENNHVNLVSVSPDQKKMLVKSNNNTQIFGANTFELICTIIPTDGSGIIFSPESDKIAFHYNKMVYVCDANSGKKLSEIINDDFNYCMKLLFSPDNQKLLVCNIENIYIYDVSSGKLDDVIKSQCMFSGLIVTNYFTPLARKIKKILS